MSVCATCGQRQYARCEGGEIEYVAGFFPCPRNPAAMARVLRPELLAGRVIDLDEWTVLPSPTAAGLEDLL